MTHLPRTRVNTCTQVCSKLTHVLSRKLLSLTKLKGEIYKTKSLGHYITFFSILLPEMLAWVDLKRVGDGYNPHTRGQWQFSSVKLFCFVLHSPWLQFSHFYLIFRIPTHSSWSHVSLTCYTSRSLMSSWSPTLLARLFHRGSRCILSTLRKQVYLLVCQPRNRSTSCNAPPVTHAACQSNLPVDIQRYAFDQLMFEYK